MEDERDESLPDRPVLSPGRRALVIAAGVVVLALVVVGVVRASTRSTPDAGPATVTVTPSPSHRPPRTTSPPPGLTKPPAALHVLTGLSRAELAAARAECPRLAPTCMTTGETPAEVGAALRAQYPKARHLVAVSDIAYTDTSGPRLAFRRLSAEAGRLRLAVEVRQSQSGDGTGSQRTVQNGESVIRCQHVAHGLTVEIQVSAPAGRYLDLAPLLRVVLDPRLLAIG